MVFGNIRDLEDYGYLEEEILKCFAYAEKHDLMSYEKGSHEIQGDHLFVNIVEYETTETENRFWEAHRNYLDLHLMLEGKERIDINFIRKSLWRRTTSYLWMGMPMDMLCWNRGISFCAIQKTHTELRLKWMTP